MIVPVAIDALEERWEAIVVGAGPAGSAAAITLRSAGLRVLVVDRQQLPRGKVCGCCLDPAAVAALERLAVGGAVMAAATPLRRARIDAWGRAATLPMRGAVLSRERLDLLLAERAAAAGVEFAWRLRARLGPHDGRDRGVIVREVDGRRCTRRLRAPLVIVAAGLGGIDAEDAATEAASSRPARRIGLGAVAPPGVVAVEPGTVRMAAAEAGYVGWVRLEDGRCDLAASVRAGALASASPAAVIGRILAAAGAPPLPDDLEWRGTPALRRVVTRWPDGVAAVGDAAGFWEPFTGEGIAWALEAGERLAPLATDLAAGRAPRIDPGIRVHQRAWMARRQLRSRAIGWLAAGRLRSRAALRLASASPALGRLGSSRLAPGAERVR